MSRNPYLRKSKITLTCRAPESVSQYPLDFYHVKYMKIQYFKSRLAWSGLPELVDEVDNCKLIKHEKYGHPPFRRPMLIEHRLADLQLNPWRTQNDADYSSLFQLKLKYLCQQPATTKLRSVQYSSINLFIQVRKNICLIFKKIKFHFSLMIFYSNNELLWLIKKTQSFKVRKKEAISYHKIKKSPFCENWMLQILWILRC